MLKEMQGNLTKILGNSGLVLCLRVQSKETVASLLSTFYASKRLMWNPQAGAIS